MNVRFSDEAKRQVRRRRTWWRKHRDEKGLFTQELRRATHELTSAPKHAVHGIRDGYEVRRLALNRIHCFVYYVIVEEQRSVEIVSVWGQEVSEQPEFVDDD